MVSKLFDSTLIITRDTPGCQGLPRAPHCNCSAAVKYNLESSHRTRPASFTFSFQVLSHHRRVYLLLTILSSRCREYSAPANEKFGVFFKPHCPSQLSPRHRDSVDCPRGPGVKASAIWHQKFTGPVRPDLLDRSLLRGWSFFEAGRTVCRDSLWESRCEDCVTSCPVLDWEDVTLECNTRRAWILSLQPVQTDMMDMEWVQFDSDYSGGTALQLLAFPGAWCLSTRRSGMLLTDLACKWSYGPIPLYMFQTSLIAAPGLELGSTGLVSGLLASPCAANFFRSSIGTLSSAL
jgi:hypothetical protein